MASRPKDSAPRSTTYAHSQVHSQSHQRQHACLRRGLPHRLPYRHQAFAFSLETLTTIGYAVPYDKGDFFNSCPGMLLLIYCGSITFILVNALIVGLIIGRLARASSRANQIIFSDKGSICCVRNR